MIISAVVQLHVALKYLRVLVFPGKIMKKSNFMKIDEFIFKSYVEHLNDI